MGGIDSLIFNPEEEHGNCIPGSGFPSGREYIDAIMADAKKTLPPNTAYSFISWTEEGKRKVGWVHNIKKPREAQKLFNPLVPGETLRT